MASTMVAGFEDRGVGDHALLTGPRHCPDFFGATSGCFELARFAKGSKCAVRFSRKMPSAWP
jgi:hypothetical protein